MKLIILGIFYTSLIASLSLNAILLYQGDYLSKEEQITKDNYFKILKEHILVPEGEPSIVTIEQNVDEFKVQNPDFYKDLQIGDKLIVFNNKAILYRPSEDVVINMTIIVDDNDVDK